MRAVQCTLSTAYDFKLNIMQRFKQQFATGLRDVKCLINSANSGNILTINMVWLFCTFAIMQIFLMANLMVFYKYSCKCTVYIKIVVVS